MHQLARCILCLIGFVFADSFVPVTPLIQEKSDLEIRSIPEELNRPIRIGLFVGVSKVYLFNGTDTISVGVHRGLVSFSTKQESVYEPIIEVFPEESLLSVAQNKKDLGKIKYHGHLVFLVQKNKLTVINVVDVEKYLYGVVPYEIGVLDSARFEALKAQAVAARTYAYSHYNSREAFQFDVFADTRDQVYKGLEKSTPLTEAAIEQTRGEVMTFNGQFIQAYYHSTCGGHTEGMDAWGQPSKSYLKPQPDLQPNGRPWCEESSYLNWERSFSEQTLVSIFNKNANVAKAKNYKPFTSIRSISVDALLKGGRIGVLTIYTNKGSFTVKGDRVRFLFDHSGILPSSNFTIKKQGSSWVLAGHGFGHGIGLCQMGARARAKAGQSYVEILKHYYKGISIERFVR